MANKHHDEGKSDGTGRISRRLFLGLSASALGGWLAGCRRAIQGPTAAPTSTSTVEAYPTSSHTPTLPHPFTPIPTPSHTPTPPPSPTSPPPLPPSYTPVPATAILVPSPTAVPATPTLVPSPTAETAPTLSHSALMAHWPATDTSRVVVVRHSGVWAGPEPDPGIVQQMLDAGINALTGIPDVLAVWRALFDPGERVLLKVNCISYGGPTQPAVTYAVAQRLQDAGLQPENILIFDRTDNELAAAGYTLNEGGSGVQCHGARGTGTEAVLTQARVRFYQELDTCDAVVNIPTPKQHNSAGVSVAMKNHYGSVDRPAALHGDWCDPAIAELNAQPNVRDKTRLIVGAALQVSPRDWNQPERENALLFSFDPVALDTVGRDILVRQRQDLGLDASYLVERSRHLATAQSLDLGATDGNLIDLYDVALT